MNAIKYQIYVIFRETQADIQMFNIYKQENE